MMETFDVVVVPHTFEQFRAWVDGMEDEHGFRVRRLPEVRVEHIKTRAPMGARLVLVLDNPSRARGYPRDTPVVLLPGWYRNKAGREVVEVMEERGAELLSGDRFPGWLKERARAALAE